MAFPLYLQHDQMDCGPACIKMISNFHGKNFTLESIRNLCKINRQGVSLLGISSAAETLGFHTIGARVNFNTLKEDATLPFIAFWNQNHFVVVYKIKKNKVYVADPAEGLLVYDKDEFENSWANTISNQVREGIILLLSPLSNFYDKDAEKEKKNGLSSLLKYLLRYKFLLFQLFVGLVVGSLLQLALPFLTKSIVDIGIDNNNLNFIHLILIAQLVLFLSSTIAESIRSWILLHINTRVSISVISDFLSKLMKLPMSFFDTKQTGDILQRIDDHEKIEELLTGSSLHILFSFFNVFIFSYVLATFNVNIFLVFLIGTVAYALWLLAFLRKRRQLDHKRFKLDSKNQSITLQLIQGVHEIKLNNCERQKRWEWEYNQAKLFKWSLKNMKLEQTQHIGGFFINEGKNIFITYLAALSVVNGSMTLGTMLAIQFIIGQMNSPIQQLITLFKYFQNARLSIRRLNEIDEFKAEETDEKGFIRELPEDRNVELKKLNFAYPGAGDQQVLHDVNITIPQGKVTAIVGASGSGKTTLLKLLLKYYELDTDVKVKIGDFDWKRISPDYWRKQCGVVLQDGYIFSDTIAKNIGLGDDEPNIERLIESAKLANIYEFIDNLPLGFNTVIGAEGHSLSQGQIQRILIARAVYKDPLFVFLDEATNSLDANNEKEIMDKMELFFEGRTVLIVAHRLSTVKNADQILVLNEGRVAECGHHDELVKERGLYYRLIQNQLELGN